jgi:hypothetical protein
MFHSRRSPYGSSMLERAPSTPSDLSLVASTRGNRSYIQGTLQGGLRRTDTLPPARHRTHIASRSRWATAVWCGSAPESMSTACGAFSMRRTADDPRPHGRAGVAGDRPYRHALRLSGAGAQGAGGAQAQSTRWPPVRFPGTPGRPDDIVHPFFQIPGSLKVFLSCRSTKLRGRRAMTPCTPIRTASVSSAATGTFHGAEGISWVAGRIP